MAEQKPALSRNLATSTQDLSPELQDVVQALCETYEAIDLRIETTLGNAETDFVNAMPEISAHVVGLRALAKFLVADVHASAQGKATAKSPILLRFAFQDEDDLVEQLLSESQARVVVLPAEGAISLHTDVQGNQI